MEVHRKCRKALLKNGTINHSEISSLFCGRSDSITVSPPKKSAGGGYSVEVSSIDGTTTMLRVSDDLITQITFYFCPFSDQRCYRSSLQLGVFHSPDRHRVILHAESRSGCSQWVSFILHTIPLTLFKKAHHFSPDLATNSVLNKLGH